MNAHTKPMGASVIPTVRYRDVGAAVEWLHEAFGLEPHRLVKDSQGSVLYGELTFGSGMVMVAPIQDSPLGKLMVQPDEIGGVETQICYLFVGDARAHHARARAAGAEIVLDIEVEANGGRGYSCRDLEGHVWNFGTYDPWVLQPAAARKASRPRRKVLLAFLLLVAAGGASMHAPAREAANGLASRIFAKVATAIGSAQAEQTPDLATSDLREQLSRERLARVAADRHVRDIREELAQERRARAAAELAAKDVRESPVQVPNPGPAVTAVDNAAAEARNELARIRTTLQASSAQLAQAQKARQAAEQDAREAREQFAQLRSTREAAEKTAREARELAVRERNTRIAVQRTLRRARESPYTPYPLQ